MSESNNQTMPNAPFSAADVTALAHLYRGEVYRSTVWRTRLDATTNWAVVATGSPSRSPSAAPPRHPCLSPWSAFWSQCFFDRGPPLPLLRLLAHAGAYAGSQLLRPDPARPGRADRQRLERDPLPGLHAPNLHITLLEAVGRRCGGTTVGSSDPGGVPISASCSSTRPDRVADDVWQRAAIGPVPASSCCSPALSSMPPGSSWPSPPIAADAAPTASGRSARRREFAARACQGIVTLGCATASRWA